MKTTLRSIGRIILGTCASALGTALILPVVLLGTPFLVVGFLTRRLARVLERGHRGWPEFMTFDETVGWRPKPGQNDYYHAAGDDIFRLVTGNDGWPGELTFEESRIVVFGDSFAFGYGVDTQHFFGELGRDDGIKAVGAPGYNMVQQLMLMESLEGELKGKLIIWFVYLGNDIYDNLSPFMDYYRSPFVKESGEDGDWEVVTSHLRPEKWACSSGRHAGSTFWRSTLASLHSPGPLSRRAYSACRFLIARGARVSRRACADLVVMTIPTPMTMRPTGIEILRANSSEPDFLDLEYPHKQLRAICADLHVGYVRGQDFLTSRLYKRHDEHWNKAGHRRVAEKLVELAEERRGVEKQARPRVAEGCQDTGT